MKNQPNCGYSVAGTKVPDDSERIKAGFNACAESTRSAGRKSKRYPTGRA